MECLLRLLGRAALSVMTAGMVLILILMECLLRYLEDHGYIWEYVLILILMECLLRLTTTEEVDGEPDEVLILILMECLLRFKTGKYS